VAVGGDVLRSRVRGHEVAGDFLELAVLGLLLLEDAAGHAVDDLSVGQDGDGEGILAVGELEHASGLDGDEGIVPGGREVGLVDVEIVSPACSSCVASYTN